MHHPDAKTSAPAWPNLSSVRVSGRSCIADPPVMSTRPQDSTHSEGLSPWKQPLYLCTCFVLQCTVLCKRLEMLFSSSCIATKAGHGRMDLMKCANINGDTVHKATLIAASVTVFSSCLRQDP